MKPLTFNAEEAAIAWAEPVVAPRKRSHRPAAIRKPRSNKGRWRKFRYGIDDAAYQRMLTAQGGVCAICKRVGITNKGGELHVDHSHVTGEVRGLLCQRCNLRLAAVEDAEFLVAAHAYLNRG